MRTRALLFCVVAVAPAACGGGSSPGGGGLYPSTCADACQHLVTCGEAAQADVGVCANDCAAEPWAANYRACRALTCGLTEAQCETYGVKTCEQACQKMVECGAQTQTGYDACVADCKTEPWAGNYIDCRATLCGASEGQCETFTGP